MFPSILTNRQWFRISTLIIPIDIYRINDNLEQCAIKSAYFEHTKFHEPYELLLNHS